MALGLLGVACPRPAPRPPEPAQQAPNAAPETEAVGVFHTLARGETLWSLAARYGVHVDELVEVNGIANPRDLRVGRLIFIPDVDPMSPTPQPLAEQARPPPVEPAPGRSARGPTPLRWPVEEGVLYSGFGLRQGVKHDGIDLGAPEGTPVLAAADGEVIYVGFDRAFGNLVILKHRDKLVTVYAHNRDVSVHIGARVKRGQRIAHVGRSGRSQGPHLHFEVRQGPRPVDPMDYLPSE